MNEKKPAAVVFLSGRERVRFTEEASVPLPAVILPLRSGYIEEFIADPRLFELLRGAAPVLAAVEDERDAAQLARVLRLRGNAPVTDDDDDDDGENHPFAPASSVVGQPIDCSAAGLARQRARNRMNQVLDSLWRFSVDARLCEFPKAVETAIDAVCVDLAKVLTGMESCADTAWRDLDIEMRRELPKLFAALGLALAEIVAEGCGTRD